MKQHILNVKNWAPVIAALVLVVTVWGCGSDSMPSAPGSVSIDDFNPPAAGSGLGLLAVSIQAVGSLNGDVSGVAGVSSEGDGGAKSRTPLADLFLTFDSIQVYPACEDTSWGDPDDELTGGQPEDPWAFSHGDSCCAPLEFLVDPLTLNAADLDTALALLLGTLALPTGEYSHLAVRIVEAWVVTQDGETIPVQLPGDEEYLKVNVQFTVADGQVTEILIRFDLARSVVETPPGSKVFMLKPVMHGVHGHGQGYMGDMGHGRGHTDGNSVRLGIGTGAGADNGDQDQIRLRDGSCDTTCTGVPDQDQIRLRDPIQDRDRDRDGTCLTTLGGDKVRHAIESRGGNDNSAGIGAQSRPRDGSEFHPLGGDQVMNQIASRGGNDNSSGNGDQIRARDGSCDSTSTILSDQIRLRDPIQDRDRDGSCDGTGTGNQ